jgi:hypothetical protein
LKEDVVNGSGGEKMETTQSERKEGFFKRILRKLDEKLQEQTKESACCGGEPQKKEDKESKTCCNG